MELDDCGLNNTAGVRDPRLRGADDAAMLAVAAAQKRVIVTEDVRTFTAAISTVPNHARVLFCYQKRFPRLNLRRDALVALACEPPPGLGRAQSPGFPDLPNNPSPRPLNSRHKCA